MPCTITCVNRRSFQDLCAFHYAINFVYDDILMFRNDSYNV